MWSGHAAAFVTAFLASLVEAVEAFTIMLAAATIRGWRPALLGGVAGLAFLTFLCIALGPMLESVPLHLLQLAIGVLLLLFGLRWLRKAVLRGAGLLPLHDEVRIFASETAALRTLEKHRGGTDWLAGSVAFKAVVLEGLEVVFIVLAVGAGRGLLPPAASGAVAACLAVAAVGFFVHRPLSQVPENAIKFTVGVILSAFGIFWTGEGLGIAWPGSDAAIPVFALVLACAAGALMPALRNRSGRPGG